MIRSTFVFLLSSFVTLSSLAADNTAQNYYGTALYDLVKRSADSDLIKNEIKQILRGGHIKTNGPDELTPACSGQKNCYQHTVIGYDNARKFLLGNYYLSSENGQYYVRDVYCNHQYSSTEFPAGHQPGPGIIPADKVVNVEHTWPQSHFGKQFAKEMQKSDLHHLFATDSQMNSTRGNFDFGVVQVDRQILKCPGSRFGYANAQSKELIFEPPNEHKGNVARALFYFSLKYELAINSTEEAVLRDWDKEDPVDSEEIKRNEAIFTSQHSRNPFIDMPGLADRISDF